MNQRSWKLLIAVVALAVCLGVGALALRSALVNPQSNRGPIDPASVVAQGLQSKDPDTLPFSAAILAKRGDKRAAEEFLGQAKSDNDDCRFKVAWAAGKAGGDCFERGISALMNDPLSLVRQQTAYCLAFSAEPAAGNLLQQRLRIEEDALVRNALCEALIIRGEKIDLDLLRKAITRPSSGDVYRERVFLAMAGEPSVIEWARKMVYYRARSRPDAVEILVVSGDRRYLDDMLDLAAKGTEDQKIGALDVLRHCLDDPRALNVLSGALDDSPSRSCAEAARGLLASGRKDAWDVLRGYMKANPGSDVTEFILRQAPVEKMDISSDTLKKLLEEGRPVTRIIAAGEILRRG
jgi:HEAT repeat protein